MRCQMRRSGVTYIAVSVWLFSLCALNAGCARSTSKTFKDGGGAESDAGDSVLPSNQSDSGQSDEPDPPFEPDAGRVECRTVSCW